MFGSKVVFVADNPIIKEWRRLFRVLYADGEMFAQGVTCAQDTTIYYTYYLYEAITLYGPTFQ